jgi:glucans biosynthesis protein C
MKPQTTKGKDQIYPLNIVHRQYFLDWIRVIVFMILIFYHCGMFFVIWSWHVKNNSTTTTPEALMEFTSLWRLPLLFFISGVGVSFAIKSKTASSFVLERSKRLLVPLIFGMLVIVPPQTYYERLQNHSFAGNYLDFYKTVLEFTPYPKGNFGWNHLWFVVYLWVFSVVAAPLFTWLKGKKLQYFNSENRNHFYSLFLFVIPLAAVYWMLSARWAVTHNLISDWYNLAISFLFFLFGYFVNTQSEFWDVVGKYRKRLLNLSIILIVFNYASQVITAHNQDHIPWFVLRGLLKMGLTWCLILTVCGFAKRYLNFKTNFVTYANRAVYPFYILHQTITIIIGYYIADSTVAVGPKFLLLVAGTFGFSWLVYHFIVRPFLLTRILFGVKQEKNRE